MRQTGKATVIKLVGESVSRVDDSLVHEGRAVLAVDGREILDTVCSPGVLDDLAFGHLLAVGWIRSTDDVLSIQVPPRSGTIHVRLRDGLTSQPREPSPLETRYSVERGTLLESVREAAAAGELFRATGATHLMAIVPDASSPIAVEDVSRTCALEKVLGRALRAGVDFAQSLLLLTSRVPMQFVRMAAGAGVPIMAAVSAPTYEAVREAERLGICLCGFVRGRRLNIYCHPWRVGQ